MFVSADITFMSTQDIKFDLIDVDVGDYTSFMYGLMMLSWPNMSVACVAHSKSPYTFVP